MSPQPQQPDPPISPPPTSPEPDQGYVLRAYVFVAGAIIAAVILTILIHAPAIVVAEGFAPFAVIYIVAQAIERLLQPLSEFVGKADDVKEAKKNEETERLKLLETERAVYFWALATCIALFVCGVLGLGLIQSVAEVGGGTVPGWFEALDVVITGLAVGAGTKPLHDLITVIQNTKKNTEGDTPAGGGGGGPAPTPAKP
jgi:hypothetical protein